MIAAFDEAFMTKTVAEWGEIFDEHDVWWVPLQRDHHVVKDPQALASGTFLELPPQMTQLVRAVPPLGLLCALPSRPTCS
jgi:crotonobetainyl-CoA:carnitine CoA-transferase CaiB-like acyl-CoA transferase